MEKPDESTLFQRFPLFYANRHALVFLCDYLRLLTLGTDNHHEMETLMDEEIETHHAEHEAVAHAITLTSDALPALGIVAAVLGVIHTMGSITEPPAVLGHLIGHRIGVFEAFGDGGNAAGSAHEGECKCGHFSRVAIGTGEEGSNLIRRVVFF